MKTIKSTVFFLLILFSVSAVLTSCSKEDETNNDVSENAKVSTYLKSFYSTTYKLGKSVNTKIPKESSILSRTTEVENLVITEVFVGDNPIARGYVITDKTTNAFLYFIDVDRTDFKLTSVKFDVNESKVFEDINQLDKYVTTNQFDYIKIAEDYASGNGSVEANRFWGWGPAHPSGDCVNGRDYWVRDYYVFWTSIAQAPEPATGGGNLWSPCGEYVNP